MGHGETKVQKHCVRRSKVYSKQYYYKNTSLVTFCNRQKLAYAVVSLSTYSVIKSYYGEIMRRQTTSICKQKSTVNDHPVLKIERMKKRSNLLRINI